MAVGSLAFPGRALGQAWGWGYNSFGQLGSGTTTNDSVPIKVTVATGIVAMAGNISSSYALDSTGKVWAWGYNNQSQLGDGTTTNSTAAVRAGTLSKIAAIAAGGAFAMALDSSGSVWAWGYNSNGQLGIGTTTNSTTPVQVSSLSKIAAIAAGGAFAMALDSSGHVWTCGYNSNGQLGIGTTTNSTTPVQVSGLSKIAGIAAGSSFGMALDSNGHVWSWGYNSNGQLGIGTTTNSTTPVQVSGLSKIVGLAGGAAFAMALDSKGKVWSWGLNTSGQLGLGTTNNDSIPAQVSALSGIATLKAGSQHALALDSSGNLWSWGLNNYGQLGDGSKINSSFPAKISSVSQITDIATGANFSLALRHLKAQTIAFPAVSSVTYGTASSVKLGASASSGLSVGYSSDDASVVRISHDTAWILAAGTVTVTASQSGNLTYDSASSVSRVLTVAKAPLTIAGAMASDKVYDGTTTATVTGATLFGKVGADDVSLVLGTAKFSSKDTGTSKSVTVSGSSLSGTAVGNYNLTEVSGLTASITAKSLTITGVTASDKVYDGTTTASLSGGALDLVVTGDAVSLVAGTGTFSDKNVGSGKTVTTTGYGLGGAGAGNYALSAQPSVTASITACPVTVTARDTSKDLGASDPVLPYTATALLSGDSWNGTLSRTVGETASKYAITQGTLTAGSNYDITFKSAWFTIRGTTSLAVRAPVHPVSHELGVNTARSFGSRVRGMGSARIGTGIDATDAQTVDVVLPGAATVAVSIFDNLGAPVISWSRDLSAWEVHQFDRTADGRWVLPVSWNARASDGSAVSAGVYLWKIVVRTEDGRKLEMVKKTGVR